MSTFHTDLSQFLTELTNRLAQLTNNLDHRRVAIDAVLPHSMLSTVMVNDGKLPYETALPDAIQECANSKLSQLLAAVVDGPTIFTRKDRLDKRQLSEAPKP